MNKKELIKAIVEEAKKRGIDISQAVVTELLDVIEVTRDNAILEGKTVKFLGCKFEHIEKPETSGTTQLGGKETKWVKPAHKAAKVSFLPSKKKSLEIGL